MAFQLAALRVLVNQCQAVATSYSEEEAFHGLALADELRAIFLARLPSLSASTLGHHAEETTLLLLPPELLTVILSALDTRSLARLAATCQPLWLDAPTPVSSPREIGPVEAELRLRAKTRGLDAGSSLPAGSTSWVSCLLKRDRRDAQRRQAPLAAGSDHSIFVDTRGRLFTCGFSSDGIPILGHAVDPDADPDVPLQIGPPTPVPSMLDRHIVSVAAGGAHCLALSAEGEAYSWGDGASGALGHGDEHRRAVPSRIKSLNRIETIAAGDESTSAAVDEDGKLFTWGRATIENTTLPYGLGYALDAQAEFQLTPKQVEALSQDRVVGVALGHGFTLAVTDAGAVLSFGSSHEGVLGQGSPEAEVLPRQIEALTQTGRRFVAVAAGEAHALALTEEGELYGWGAGRANGHGHEEQTPRRVAALIGQHVKLMDARHDISCAVTEKGELFTWSKDGRFFNLGHGVDTPQATPRWVDALGGVRVAAVAINVSHTLAADEDGVVWAFGRRSPLGMDNPNISPVFKTPTSIPSTLLRVRALKSP